MEVVFLCFVFDFLFFFKLTSSSSGSSLRVSVCGTVWPSNLSSSWLCETARGPHGSPSSFSFHGDPNGSRAACGVTQCVRSGATRETKQS